MKKYIPITEENLNTIADALNRLQAANPPPEINCMLTSILGIINCSIATEHNKRKELGECQVLN